MPDCKEAYKLSWRLGLKANALYRDGSKLSQPLQSQLIADDEEDDDVIEAFLDKPAASRAAALSEKIVEKVVERIVVMRERVRMPDGASASRRRPGRRAQDLPAHRRVRRRHARRNLHRHAQGGRRLPLPHELLRDERVSVGLQYGVPLETYVEQFTFTRFEPSGPVQGNNSIK